MLSEQKFIDRNKDKWLRLEAYNRRLAGSKKITALSKDEIREYASLYRITGHHLSYAKTYYKTSKVTDYLNQLTGLGHAHFYTREKGDAEGLRFYLTKGFPRAVRKYARYFWASLAIFFIGFCFLLALAAYDGGFINYFIPESLVENNNITGNSGEEAWAYPLLSSFIMTNNIKVSLQAFAYGLFFGIGTLYILAYNGMVIGAFYGMVLLHNMPQLRFWALILPHGFLELTAIFLSGAAGLIMGGRLLLPGSLSRRHALLKGAKEGAYLLPGIVLMLILAGLIEGFFTPLALPDGVKLGFAFLTLGLTAFYFCCAGGEKPSGSPST